MNTKSIHRASSIAFALLALSANAFADGGNVTSVSATPNAVFPGDAIHMKVVVQSVYGTSCKLHWALKDASNQEIKGNTHKVQADANSTEFAGSFAAPAPGNYMLEVTGGPGDSQTLTCGGKVATAVVVKDRMAISTTPVATTVSMRPATPPVLQMPVPRVSR